MALDLHSKCSARLKEALAEHLANLRVNNRTFLEFESTAGILLAEQILPETGKLHHNLREYIGELPLFSFISDSLNSELMENETYDANSSNLPITSLDRYRDIKELANRLVQEFESLPWHYTVSLELPVEIGEHIKNATARFDLSSNLRIFCPVDDDDRKQPLNSGIEKRDLMLFGPATSLSDYLTPRVRKWNQKTAYIQADTSGFIADYHWTSPIQTVLSAFKSFLGLSVAVRLLHVKTHRPAPLFSIPKKAHLIVHRKYDADWRILTTYELPSDLVETLDKLGIGDADGQIKPNQFTSWIESALSKVSTAFRNPTKSERVLLAGQWLLDSYVGSNELLSFVQTAVAMEILLGEEGKSDVIGIGELLRNRCAYLIGRSHSQRERILKDFGKIYDVRSKIVHRGKSKLNAEEYHLFQNLRWMCRRVIAEELKLISEDKMEAV